MLSSQEQYSSAIPSASRLFHLSAAADMVKRPYPPLPPSLLPPEAEGMQVKILKSCLLRQLFEGCSAFAGWAALGPKLLRSAPAQILFRSLLPTSLDGAHIHQNRAAASFEDATGEMRDQLREVRHESSSS